MKPERFAGVWFDKLPQTPDWSKAMRHLRRDPIMREIIKRVGKCTLAPRGDPFSSLCKAIFSQQLSTVVAANLFGRFQKLFPRAKPTPKHAIKLLKNCDESVPKSCGLSRQKLSYLIDLAEKFADGSIPMRRFDKMSDEEVIDALLPVKGIGRWTAEMFLIFVLNRPDVLPVDDLGLQKAATRFYALKRLPNARKLEKLAEPWRPYRSIATWYLWRGLSQPIPSVPKKRR